MDPLIKIPTPKILFSVNRGQCPFIDKEYFKLVVILCPMYPSLNVTFIEIILVYTVKSTKTTKRNN